MGSFNTDLETVKKWIDDGIKMRPLLGSHSKITNTGRQFYCYVNFPLPENIPDNVSRVDISYRGRYRDNMSKVKDSEKFYIRTLVRRQLILSKVDAVDFLVASREALEREVSAVNLYNKFINFIQAGIICSITPAEGTIEFLLTPLTMQKFVEEAAKWIKEKAPELDATMFNPDEYFDALVDEMANEAVIKSKNACKQIDECVSGEIPVLKIQEGTSLDPRTWVIQRMAEKSFKMQQEAADKETKGLVTKIINRAKIINGAKEITANAG